MIDACPRVTGVLISQLSENEIQISTKVEMIQSPAAVSLAPMKIFGPKKNSVK